jgi:hypothetical protein
MTSSFLDDFCRITDCQLTTETSKITWDLKYPKSSFYRYSFDIDKNLRNIIHAYAIPRKTTKTNQPIKCLIGIGYEGMYQSSFTVMDEGVQFVGKHVKLYYSDDIITNIKVDNKYEYFNNVHAYQWGLN